MVTAPVEPLKLILLPAVKDVTIPVNPEASLPAVTTPTPPTVADPVTVRFPPTLKLPAALLAVVKLNAL